MNVSSNTPVKGQQTFNAQNNPQIMQVYLYYRLILATLLWLTFSLSSSTELLGRLHPQLFQITSLVYIAISLATMVAFRSLSLRHSTRRTGLLLVIDLIALMLLIHASDGLKSSLGYLILVNVAMASVFIRGQLAFAYAALCSLFAIAEAINLGTKGSSNDLFAAGTLGILIFITAISFHYLIAKIQESDTAAAFQAKYARHLQQLAQHIVTRMRTGIVVIDKDDHIELINQSALQLLDLPAKNYNGTRLTEKADLENLIKEWHASPDAIAPKIHTLRAGQEVRLSFAKLETPDAERTIMYMEDHRSLAQQAQQLKLASLGRLTASIAHEVRNPLGAISHATQLLSEADYLQPGDRRLIEIILQHSERVNQIIENTLTISRRKEPKPKILQLAEWLPKFINEYQASSDTTVGLSLTSANATAKFDPVHLRQVLTNLCDNGARFSKDAIGKALVEIHAGISDNEETAFIEVIDNGPGVSQEQLGEIFDPFYTTDEKGSGLGLYISRELCEINQASLYFKRTDDNKSCFRINCSHHQRMI